MNIEPLACDASNLSWTKSSYSGGNGGECVEVALSHTSVHVRDSKIDAGPRLSVGPGQWTAFVQFALEDDLAAL